MARKSDIQYINFYTDGSAARKLELITPRKETPVAKPKPRPAKKQVIYVDPLALCSIAVSAVMLVLMVVGIFVLNDTFRQEQDMADYVQTLQNTNQQLQEQYEAEIDLEQIEQAALALGMVPASQVEHITIQVAPETAVQEESTAWDAFLAFFGGLFA